MALRWVFTTRQKHMLPGVTMEMIENIPGMQRPHSAEAESTDACTRALAHALPVSSSSGTVSDRSTMRGQLNWIFTAITDTISWNILPADLFHRIFRNDLLVAALFRNFLLAVSPAPAAPCTSLHVL